MAPARARSAVTGPSLRPAAAMEIQHLTALRGSSLQFLSGGLSISRRPVCLIGNHSEKEEAMKYMLLIHQGSTPLPGTEAWDQLSDAERQAVFADYGAINNTPGVTPGEQMQAPETATTVQVHDGKTLTTDGPFVELKEAVGGYLFYEAEDLD